MEKEQGRPSLPDLEKFAQQFRMKYGREMTDDERRWFKATEELLKHPPEQQSAAAN